MTLRRLLTSTLVAAVALPATPAWSSSHREAPLITEMPKVDGTDFYMFRSYESGREGYVTFIANYQPLQASYGGPNYFSLDPDAIYEIHVDNTGDGVEDVTFQFDFDLALKGGRGLELQVGSGATINTVAIPLTISGPISAEDDADRQLTETYSLNVVRGDRRTGTKQAITRSGGGAFRKPLDYIGQKTFADYEAYADAHIYEIDIPGCTPPSGTKGRVFVGQRREGFAVNLGEIFDLVNAGIDDSASGFNAIGDLDQNENTIGNLSVTSLALEIPIACVKAEANAAIGAWTTASVRQARVINPTGTFEEPTREGGPWVQVSRLGMPLVNEVVIGLPDKDKFNGSEPKDDLANFGAYVVTPTLPELLEILFPGILTAPNTFPRTDLVAAFATGVPGVNAVGATPVPSEMLRLNLTFDPTPKGSQFALGAAACFDEGGVVDTTNASCDVAGFPNGRRPGDDVVDVSLRVAMGFLLPTVTAPNAATPLTDGAAVSDADFSDAFPYLLAPLRGSPTPVVE